MVAETRTPDTKLKNPELQKMYEETYSYLNWEHASAFGAGDTWRENEAKKHMANITALCDEVVRLQGDASVIGTIEVLRSEDKDAENCKCCEGRHAYSRWFNFDEYIDFHDWITQQFQFPSLEGRKVQITATLLPENQ